MTKIITATINCNHSNSLHNKSVQFTISGNKELFKEENIQELAMDALAELEEGNEDDYRDWLNNGAQFDLK